MPLYSLSIPFAQPVAFGGGPVLELYTTETDQPRLMELSYSSNTQSQIWLELGRPAVVGVLPQSPTLLQAEDPAAPASTVKVVTAWGTPPTIPAQFLRRSAIQNVTGGGIKWIFRKGVVIPASGSLVLWSLQGNVLGYVDVVVDL